MGAGLHVLVPRTLGQSGVFNPPVWFIYKPADLVLVLRAIVVVSCVFPTLST